MIRGRQIQKKTEIQTQRQIQRQTHTHRCGEISNTQSQKDPNAKIQMFRLRPPTFGGKSLSSEKIDISASRGRFEVANSRGDGTIIWKV